MIKAPGDEWHSKGSLDDFASEQPDEEGSGQESTSVWNTREGLAPREEPPPTLEYLSESEGLDAFDDQHKHSEPAQLTASVAASSVATVGIATATTGTPTAFAGVAATRRPTAVPVPRPRPLVVISIERFGRDAYLYGAIALATLIVLTAGFLTLRRPAATQPTADQPALTRNEAPAAPSPASTADITSVLPDPAALVARGNTPPPIEQIADRTSSRQPAPRRVAPAESARSERRIPSTTSGPPQVSPRLQTQSIPVAPVAVAPRATTGFAPLPTPTISAAPVTASTSAAPVTTSAPATSPSATAPSPAPAPTPAPAPMPSAPSPANAAAADAIASPAVPAPVPAAPSNAAASALEIDTRAVRQVLERYRNAFNALDANAAQDVWPGVNQRALSRAFERLDEQDVSFRSCRIDVNRAAASAVCGGVVRYVPSVGSRTQREEQREWSFRLRRERNEWFIEGVDTR